MIAQGVVGARAEIQVCSGGDIHQSYVVRDEGQSIFVKANHKDFAPVLASEYESLNILQELVPDYYPRPGILEIASSPFYLTMEFFAMAPLTPHNAAGLGRLLAEQHTRCADEFGWPQTNHIGLSKQPNQQCSDWGDFFWLQRLQPQLDLAQKNNLQTDLIYSAVNLESKIVGELSNLDVQPSLLHGDLWLGNAAYDELNNRPILFDPAPYFGDPVADLAMTRLFGSFPAEFYTGYHAIHPIRPEQDWLEAVYNLYHALNHFNLFGSGYSGLINKLVRKI